jgi:hypothetical protein
MPEYLPLPDGSFLTLKKGQDPKDAWLKAVEKYPEAFGVEPPKPEEPTVGGQIKEFGKGIIPGAVGMGQTALTGISALLPEEQEKAARQYIDSGAAALKAPFAAAPGYEDTVGRKFGEAAGSILPFIATGPFGMAGRAAMVGMGVGAGAGEARIRAEQEGATPEQRSTATALGTLPGAAEVFAPMKILGRLADPIKQGIMASVKRALVAGGEEAAQEAASQIAQNLIAKGVYKPDQSIVEQVGESAAYGGATGALVQGILDMAIGRRARPTPKQQPAGQPVTPAGAPATPAEGEIPEPTLQGAVAPATPETPEEIAAKPDKAAKKLADEQAAFLAKYEEQQQQREAEAAEYERIKAMSPEEYAADQLGGVKVSAPKVPQPPADETGYYTEYPKPPTAPAPDQAYAAQQMALAKDREPAPDLKTYLDYLMQDPVKAQSLLENRTQIPGVTAKQSEALLGGIKMQLKARGDAAAKAETERVSTAQERARGLFERQANPEDFMGAAREQEGVKTQEVVKPEREALLRMGNRPTPYLTANRDVEAERDLDKRVGELVDTLPKTDGRITPGDVYLGLGTKKQDIRDLQAQLAVARMTGNRELQQEIKSQLDQERPLASEGVIGTEGGKNAAEIIGRSKLPDMRVAEAEGDKYASEQRSTMLGLARLLSSKTVMLPAKKAELISNAKESYIAQHAAEIEARRKAFGLPPMEDWERAEARARSLEGLNTLTNNWGQFEDPVISVKALQNITREAVYQNINKAAQRKADVETERTAPTPKGTRYTTVGGEEMFVPDEKKARVAAPDELTLTGEPRRKGTDKENAIDTIDMVLRSVERRTRAEPTVSKRPPTKVGSMAALADLFEAEESTGRSAKTDEASVELLQRLRNQLQTNTDPEFVSLAKETATRIAEGNIPNAFDVRDLGEMMAQHEEAGRSTTRPGATQAELQRTSAQPQKDLFPEAAVQVQRATPGNFQKMLDSKDVQGMRNAIEQQRKDNLEVLQSVGKALPTLTNRLNQAKAVYDRKLKKAQKDVSVASAYQTEYANDLTSAQDAVTAWGDERTKVETALEQVESIKDALRKEPSDMAFLINANKVLSQEPALRKQLKTIDAALANANAFVTTINATNEANQTLIKPAVARAEKADQERLDAQAELNKVRNEAAQAAQRKKNLDEREQAAKEKAERIIGTPEEQFRASQQAGREGLGLPGERIERDTTALQKQVNGLRSKMGSISDRITKAKTEAAREKLEAQYDETEAALYALPEKAPIERTGIAANNKPTAVDIAYEKEREKLSREQNKILQLATTLPNRKVGPITTDVRTGRKAQAGQRKEVIGNSQAVTNALISRRAELAELQRRETYLKDNKKPVPEKLTKSIDRAQKRVDQARTRQTEVAASELETRAQLLATKVGAKNLKIGEARAFVKTNLREASDAFNAPSLTLVKKDIADAVRDGRIMDALDGLAKFGSNKLTRDLAERLRPLLMRTKIRTEPGFTVEGKAATGAYLSETNEIVIDDRYITQETLMHEFVHAATSRVLNTPDADLTPSQRKAKAELQALYNKVKNDAALVKEYGLTDIEEFASEAMSNEVFQQKLEQIKTDGKSGWQRFKEAVMRFFGVDIRSNAFEDAQEAIDGVFTASRKAAGAVKPALFRQEASAPGFEDALGTAEQLIAKPKTIRQHVNANLGLGFRTQWLDRLAPLEKVANEMLDSLNGTQMMYYLRMADQKMSFVQQSVGRGVPQLVEHTRKDGRKERIIESKEGPNLADVVETLKGAPGMNADAANKLFTLYLAAKRGDRVGYDKLNFGVDESQIKSSVAKIESNKELRAVFETAREQYNAYNRDLMRFMEQTGALTPEEAQRLAKTNDYIPFYREENGNALLVIGGEGTFKVGSLAEQPQLRQLIGGNDKILDFLTSSVENTSILVDMGLRNVATKNAMFELANLNLVKFLGGTPSGPDIVSFKDRGVDKYVRVMTDDIGIPAQLLVKGMEGIPVNNSAVIKAMGGMSTLLRRSITINPLYSARQVFRDSVAAPLLSGANFSPVFGALRQIGQSTTKEALEARGIIGGQIFTGTNADLSRILGELQAGKMGVSQFIARAEAISMEADALTRRAQYDSYIEQGLSEMEATLMSLESMNFNRKGVSPSVRMASTLIPFFNAQLQSLDVLYRALTGKMPMNERLDIQGKLLRRGALLAGTAVAYALLMGDDETYKNATPDEKYGNFFIHIPGMKESLRVPVPFEVGYIFKSLPEAIVNIMRSDEGAQEALKAFTNIAIQTIPGGSSALMPAAAKPLLENLTGYSFFTGRQLESKAEQMEKAEFRFRDNTSELAKQIGSLTGTSPIKVDNLIRGYTGSMGVALAQAFNFAMPTSGGPEQAAKRLSDTPVIGPLFQPENANGIAGAVYDRLTDIQETKRTYDKLIKEGRRAEAGAFLQDSMDTYAKSALGGNVQTQLNKITQAINAVKASTMSATDKRDQLENLQKIRIQIASSVRGFL